MSDLISSAIKSYHRSIIRREYDMPIDHVHGDSLSAMIADWKGDERWLKKILLRLRV